SRRRHTSWPRDWSSDVCSSDLGGVFEMGTIILVGATTENPSFEVNSALLSRCRVYVLHALGEAELLALLRRALADSERGLAGLRSEECRVGKECGSRWSPGRYK